MLCSLTSFSQHFEEFDSKTIFIFKNCEFIDPHPDCLNHEIPYVYRTNQKDTITCLLDKEYMFYKGKCDTICWNDTIDLFTNILNIYYADSLDEFFETQFISLNLELMKEANFTATKSNSELLRFSFFRDTLPITVTIEKFQDQISITKKVFSGDFWSPELEIDKMSETISEKKWSKLYERFQTVIDFEPKEEFLCGFPNLLIETLINNNYSCLYLHRNEFTIDKKTRKSIKRIERILKI